MLKKFLLDLLFPVECLGCRQEGAWLCASCFKKLRFGAPAYASSLAMPGLDKILMAGDYDDPLLAEAIKRFKYDLIIDLGPILGRFLTLFWQGQTALPGTPGLISPLIIPLPLSKKRFRFRGFNQAEILARELSAALGYPLNRDLERIKHQPPQAGLDADERHKNIRGAFAWKGADLQGRDIILLDDVMTTGATLSEAALILKTAGAGRIYGLVLAKG